MPRQENPYKKHFDEETFRELRPAGSGIYADRSGVYLTGTRFWEGDEWEDVENGTASVGGVFKFSKCKDLFDETDVIYSHKVIIEEDRLWGMANYYVRLRKVDPKNFKHIKPLDKFSYDLDGYYFRDADAVYYLNGDQDTMLKVNSRSPHLFVVHGAFAHDDKKAYFLGKRIAQSDGASFRKSGESIYLFEDDKRYFENDNWSRVVVKTK